MMGLCQDYEVAIRQKFPPNNKLLAKLSTLNLNISQLIRFRFDIPRLQFLLSSANGALQHRAFWVVVELEKS